MRELGPRHNISAPPEGNVDKSLREGELRGVVITDADVAAILRKARGDRDAAEAALRKRYGLPPK